MVYHCGDMVLFCHPSRSTSALTVVSGYLCVLVHLYSTLISLVTHVVVFDVTIQN